MERNDAFASIQSGCLLLQRARHAESKLSIREWSCLESGLLLVRVTGFELFFFPYAAASWAVGTGLALQIVHLHRRDKNEANCNPCTVGL